jgi:hypothetical protein
MLYEWLGRKKRESKSKQALAYRPRLEALEDRTVPSTGFAPLLPFATTGLAPRFGAPSQSIVSGDFNGDGKTDVAIANLTPGTGTPSVTVLTGLGNGRFNPVGTGGSTTITLKNEVAGTASIQAIAVGDFNKDGIADLAVLETVAGAPNMARVHILLGSATGFTEPNLPLTVNIGTRFAQALAIGNFDGDPNNLPDIAVLESNEFVDFFFNSGGANPTFTGPATLDLGATQTNGVTLVAGNFTNSANTDLTAIFNNAAAPTAVLLIGQGTGAGTNNTHFVVGSTTNLPGTSVTAAAAGNFDGVGGADLVTVSNGAAVANVLVSTGTGFNSAAVVQVPLPAGVTGANAVVTGDFNGDGQTDFATGNVNSTVSIFLSNRASSSMIPSFGTPQTIAVGSTQIAGLALGRFTNSGKVDIVALDGAPPATTGLVGVLQNQFSNGYFAIGSGPGTQAIINIYSNSGTGQLLGTIFPYLTAPFTGGVRVAEGDVNGDGVPDLIVAAGPGLGGAALVKVYDGAKLLNLLNGGLSNGNAESALLGLFQPYGTNGVGLGNFVAAGDFDGKGVDEVVVGADVGAQPQVSILAFNRTTGTFLAPPNQTFPQFAFLVGPATFTGGIRVAAADINGDGKDDLITAFGPGANPVVNVFLGQDDGTPPTAVVKNWINTTPAASFTGIFSVPIFTGGLFVTAGDFDGDGFADVAVSAGPGAGPQVEIFRGSAITRQINGGAAIQQAPPDASAFNNILVPPGNPYLGGATLGVAVGLYPDSSNPGGTILERILLSGSGPGGNQVQGFDVYQFMNTPLFTSGQRPNGAIPGFFYTPPGSSFTGGEFVTTS